MKILVGGMWVVGVGMFVLLQGCSGGSDSPNESMGGSGGSAAGSTAAAGGSGGSAGQAQSGGNAGETGGGGASAGTGGEGGGLAGGGQGGGSAAATAFVPDVPEEYVGKIVSPGMEVVAHTAREVGSVSKEWLMAVKNTGTAHLCAIDVSFSFLDANGGKLGGGTSVPLDIPLERGNAGKGGHTSCLAPGKIGMLKDTGSLLDVDIGKIAKVTHEFGAIILSDAVPTDDIKVTDVKAVPGSITGQVFSGTLKNDGTTGVKNPSVAIYGVNAVGRPLFSSEAIELVSVAAGSSWMFKTIGSFTEQFSDYAAYPRVSDL